MTRKPDGPLRRGWTTGACAAAATKAAYTGLLTGRFPDPITIALPRGGEGTFALTEKARLRGGALAAVTKDAGDDPDVTHGALVRVAVRRLSPHSGVLFVAGEGVGVVTRPGLPVSVGEPAINPGPRAMIREIVADVAGRHGDPGNVEVTVSVPGGRDLAAKTVNARLGIVGGLSILGTTGIVVPYSCAAWISSIHRGVDVARAAGLRHLAAATGSTSERAVKRLHDLPDVALIEMGDFVGGLLKYLRRNPVPRLTVAGGFAKIAKLAMGHLDLHSSRSAVDFGQLASLLRRQGAPAALTEEALHANTATQVLGLAATHGLPLGDEVAAAARRVVLAQLDGTTEVEVLVFDREGRLVGQAFAAP